MPRHWIAIAAEAHVLTGRDAGFAQIGHGRMQGVAALSPGDWLAYYAPRTTLEGGTPVRAFVAIGRVISDAPYRATQGEGFHPWRVDMDFLDASPAPIRPLLDRLSMTWDRGRHWGIAFRGSRVAATAADMRLIAEAMQVAPGALPDP